MKREHAIVPILAPYEGSWIVETITPHPYAAVEVMREHGDNIQSLPADKYRIFTIGEYLWRVNREAMEA